MDVFCAFLALRGTPIKKGDRELTKSYSIDFDLSRSNSMHHLGLCSTLNKVPRLVQWKIKYPTRYVYKHDIRSTSNKRAKNARQKNIGNNFSRFKTTTHNIVLYFIFIT